MPNFEQIIAVQRPLATQIYGFPVNATQMQDWLWLCNATNLLTNQCIFNGLIISVEYNVNVITRKALNIWIMQSSMSSAHL
jgi:hypothetical protein